MNRRRTILAGAAGVLLLALAGWGGSRAGTALVVFQPAEPPDAILSLASHEWERLPAVADLAQQFPASAVLLTVPTEISENNCHRCLERPAWLAGLGVAASRIQVLPDRGESTYDEAVAARRYAREHGIRRLAVVTSPYHTRRALATFRDVFKGVPVELGMYPACEDSPARPARWWAARYDRAYVVYEWTASLYYTVARGVPLGGGQAAAPDEPPCAHPAGTVRHPAPPDAGDSRT